MNETGEPTKNGAQARAADDAPAHDGATHGTAARDGDIAHADNGRERSASELADPALE
jgi:hypothetical protein